MRHYRRAAGLLSLHRWLYILQNSSRGAKIQKGCNVVMDLGSSQTRIRKNRRRTLFISRHRIPSIQMKVISGACFIVCVTACVCLADRENSGEVTSSAHSDRPSPKDTTIDVKAPASAIMEQA